MMAGRRVVLGIIVASAAVCVTVLAQEGQRFPGPGSGIIKVAVVGVDGNATIRTAQEGPWRVALSEAGDVRVINTPTVSIASPGFIREGGRYSVIWPSGERQVIRVVQLGGGGWVRVDSGPGGAAQSWVNLTVARSVESTS